MYILSLVIFLILIFLILSLQTCLAEMRLRSEFQLIEYYRESKLLPGWMMTTTMCNVHTKWEVAVYMYLDKYTLANNFPLLTIKNVLCEKNFFRSQMAFSVTSTMRNRSKMISSGTYIYINDEYLNICASSIWDFIT